jgi:hypothetical protein
LFVEFYNVCCYLLSLFHLPSTFFDRLGLIDKFGLGREKLTCFMQKLGSVWCCVLFVNCCLCCL